MKAPVEEGDVLAGKYRVDKILGVGGMGVVVAAHHIQLDEKVALKFLLPEVAMSRDVVARFSREAQAAVKIKSEHVARVSDVGTLDNGSPYMVLEYLEGGDLTQWLKRHGHLPVEQAVDFILQACEALAEAHALGIIHRDLKPANLFVTRRRDGTLSIKVLDFGISKVTQTSSSGPDLSLTKTSAMMGSPLYMSPEQLESAKNVDARTDIWALGVVLYQLLTGKVPFDAETLPELFRLVLTTEPSAMTTLRPELPVELDDAVQRCLRKDREQRFRHIAELAHALLPFGSAAARTSVERVSRVIHSAGLAEGDLDLPPSSATPGVDETGASTAGAWGQTAPGTAPRSRSTWLLVPGAIGLLGVIAFVATAEREAPAPAASTPATIDELAPMASAVAESSTETASAEPAASPVPSASAAVLAVSTPVPPVEAPAPKEVPHRAAPLPAPAPKSPTARTAPTVRPGTTSAPAPSPTTGTQLRSSLFQDRK